MLDYEKKYYSKDIVFIAGCDEAGRGPLAGPVVAAAVIMQSDFQNEEVNDSKKLTDKKRRKLFEIIKENAIAYAVAIIDADTIDKINIYEASRLGMETALRNLNHKYDMVLTDYMPLLHEQVNVEAIAKGDAKSFNIACASILAKVTRDDLMIELDKKYPEYGFKKHKGYGTKQHLEALEKYGAIPHIHRQTYAPVSNLKCKQLTLF